jgi:hypothetical protein
MFVTLECQGYVRHNGTLLCFSDCDATMFITLKHYYVSNWDDALIIHY